MIKQLHLIIKGTVQGVFYRQSTKQKAEELGVYGVVKNLENGDVDVVAEGEEDKLKMLLDWCWKGPENSDVEDIIVKWRSCENKYSAFRILY
jgi:acylphosphatase